MSNTELPNWFNTALHTPSDSGTVTVEGRCFGLFMPAQQFREMIMTHPAILEFVSTLSAERRVKNAQILDGQSEYLEAQLDLL